MKIDDHGIFVFSPIIFRQSHGPWKWDLWVTFFEVNASPSLGGLVKPSFLVHSTGCCRRGFGNWKVVARSS